MAHMYIVCWGASSCDDHGCAHANVGIHGVYSTRPAARLALVECKDQIIDDTRNDLDPDCECSYLVDELGIKVYGSEEEEYFDIDYTIGTDSCEVHITIIEQ